MSVRGKRRKGARYIKLSQLYEAGMEMNTPRRARSHAYLCTRYHKARHIAVTRAYDRRTARAGRLRRHGSRGAHGFGRARDSRAPRPPLRRSATGTLI